MPRVPFRQRILEHFQSRATALRAPSKHPAEAGVEVVWFHAPLTGEAYREWK